ncbi:MAG: RsmE family RNA methyltransferase [Spirochaetales bacterium]
MRQLVLPEGYAGEPEVELDEENAHYLVRVLRLRRDDSFPAIDRHGRHYHCTIVEAGDRVRLRIQAKGTPQSDRPAVTVVQCLPKGRKFDDVIRRCTEAGVSALQPVFSDFTVVRFEGQKVDRKLERWRRVATEALQQSGSAAAATIDPPLSLDRFLEHEADRIGDNVLRLILHQSPLEQSSLHEYLAGSARHITLLVGPEGGFSDRELALAREAGYKPAYLGPYVLRTETAALYATAAVQTIILEKSTWRLKSTYQE